MVSVMMDRKLVGNKAKIKVIGIRVLFGTPLRFRNENALPTSKASARICMTSMEEAEAKTRIQKDNKSVKMMGCQSVG